ncbi:hypothetical protein EIQ28_05330 [Xanthomonas campestris pv. plantaginis]
MVAIEGACRFKTCVIAVHAKSLPVEHASDGGHGCLTQGSAASSTHCPCLRLDRVRPTRSAVLRNAACSVALLCCKRLPLHAFMIVQYRCAAIRRWVQSLRVTDAWRSPPHYGLSNCTTHGSSVVSPAARPSAIACAGESR